MIRNTFPPAKGLGRVRGSPKPKQPGHAPASPPLQARSGRLPKPPDPLQQLGFPARPSGSLALPSGSLARPSGSLASSSDFPLPARTSLARQSVLTSRRKHRPQSVPRRADYARFSRYSGTPGEEGPQRLAPNPRASWARPARPASQVPPTTPVPPPVPLFPPY